MKELTVQQTQLVIDYLNARISDRRAAAETYHNDGKYDHEMIALTQASEMDCTLNYLLGIMHHE